MHLSCGTGATRRDVVFAPLPRRVRVRTSERRIAFLLGRAARDWEGKAERKKRARARGSKNMLSCDGRFEELIDLKLLICLERPFVLQGHGAMCCWMLGWVKNWFESRWLSLRWFSGRVGYL